MAYNKNPDNNININININNSNTTTTSTTTTTATATTAAATRGHDLFLTTYFQLAARVPMPACPLLAQLVQRLPRVWRRARTRSLPQ